MSTLSTANIESKAANTPPVIKDLNGTECGQFCRAWVNFDGTSIVSIRDNFNVSSITDNGTGNYTVNFTTALANQNYSVVGIANGFSVIEDSGAIRTGTRSTSSIEVRSVNGAATAYVDTTAMQIAIFGG